MNAKLMETAKAWAALIGAVVTALLGTVAPDKDLYEWLTFIAAACTAIAVYSVRNAPPALARRSARNAPPAPPVA